MKRNHQKIWPGLLLAASLLWQAFPARAMQTPQQETALGGADRQAPAQNLKSLLETGRGPELRGLLVSLFGEDAAAAQGVLDEEAEALAEAVGAAAVEKGAEAQQEEIDGLKGKLKAPPAAKPRSAPAPKPAARPAGRRRAANEGALPRLDWRQLAFGFAPLRQEGKPEVKITQTDKQVSAEGESNKSFETDKASMKRTQKAESKFIKDGEVFGVEIKHTEVIEGKAKTGSQYFRKETVMFWSARVAACPDVKGVDAGTGKGYVTARTTITGEAGTATVSRTVTADTKTTGYVDDEAEMTHYDLEAEAVETIAGYDDAAARKLMTDVTFRDGRYTLRYEMTGNKIEINKTAEGGPRTPAKMGRIVVKMVPGSNAEDVKRTDKAAGALVAGIWNHTNDMYKAARSHWRNYGCVECVARAPKHTLKNGERVVVEVETVHKQDSSKVNARLEAGALDASVTPEQQQATPSAKFGYTHGDLEKSDFTVESFSKRGIGIGGLEFITERECAGGFSGKIEIVARKTEGWTKVTKKGEHISDQHYSGTAQYKWSYDYQGAFDVADSPGDTDEAGDISATLKGAVTARASRVTDETDNWTTTTDCFPDPPRTAGKNSFSLIKEEGRLTGTIDDGVLQIKGAKYRIAFSIPEIRGTRTHRTQVKPFGWCMADANPPSDTTDESTESFSAEAVEFEGALDPKNPNLIQGSKTFTDELGNEVTITWRLVACGGGRAS
ncbi:MAG TPA: hypothetical protein VK422_05800 [Pyrinomonadaceae bacterium]|nr:hypothetical protein [Pyrinomonadaceae bacterium]